MTAVPTASSEGLNGVPERICVHRTSVKRGYKGVGGGRTKHSIPASDGPRRHKWVKVSLRDEPAHVSLRPERARTATSTQGARLLGPSGGIHKPPYAKRIWNSGEGLTFVVGRSGAGWKERAAVNSSLAVVRTLHVISESLGDLICCAYRMVEAGYSERSRVLRHPAAASTQNMAVLYTAPLV
ncbi:hypothetical protein FA13DRAFT_1714916 [Coprinellus micaceus]|uniref:Uncharacterized protein n=1 Tax=Coprinellus micaceus TaxID=71717 RepID=A0A4Y7SQL7_COPMI|nr:hypothetical protein FA13DRAFT_1714916 [Coprinellus micaceus]